MLPKIAQVALPVPLDRQFDYLIPEGCAPVVGGRVWVTFRQRPQVGIVTALLADSPLALDKLKPITKVIDTQPLWSLSLQHLLQWCSQFYHYPLGETFANAMPTALRKGKPAQAIAVKAWQITTQGQQLLAQGLGRAIAQHKALSILAQGAKTQDQLQQLAVSLAVLKALKEKQAIEEITWTGEPEITSYPVLNSEHLPLKLNTEQAIAVASVYSQQGFGCYLLQGVTGSGKTEVYLQLIAAVLEQGKQALVLVPEIGLTPQTIRRFQRRFNTKVAVVHSGLNETERLNAWLAARDHQAGVVIGTRSAIFTPFAQLGIIIVDEEHDGSYKQQDSLRYHARDVAVMRANNEQIPILLGSATPALESIYNAQKGKYKQLSLTQRAGMARPASHRVLDVKGLPMVAGLSEPLIAHIRQHLSQGNQVLLFLNRRGFSPALMCHACGWLAHCHRCDAYYTYHQVQAQLRCHHCGAQHAVVHHCQQCGSSELVTKGVGTEQLEAQLGSLFPDYPALRIDRDSTRRKGSLESALMAIEEGKFPLLIGTQMLAKGHHFPNVTLVALLDVDAALYSSDFRAAEQLAQLFVQVAGRAGRAQKAGEVVLQTHHPEHPLLQALLHQGYEHFAEQALWQRQQAGLPPYSYFALFRAESHQSELALEFLRQLRTLLSPKAAPLPWFTLWGPSPAPLAKKAGKYRWQLVLSCSQRTLLQQLLQSKKKEIAQLPLASKVRWSLDVDPQEMS